MDPADPKPRLHPLLERYAVPPSRIAPPSGAAPPPSPGPVTPRALQEGVWSHKGFLIVRNGAMLPGRCVMCNRSTGNRWRTTFYWTPPSLRGLLPLGRLIYGLLNISVRERSDLAIPLCEEHDGKRRALGRNSWLMALGGIALIGVSVMAMFDKAAGIGGLLMGIGFLTLIIASVLSSSSSLFKVKRIDSRYTVLEKAGDGYLRSLPPAPRDLVM